MYLSRLNGINSHSRRESPKISASFATQDGGNIGRSTKIDMRGITSAEKIYKIISHLPPLGLKSTQSQVFLPPHMSYFCPVQNWFSPFILGHNKTNT